MKPDVQQDLDTVSRWLLDASTAIAADYVMLPIAGQEEAAYRERVYCYELYHQWRLHWDGGCPYMVCGVIDKQGHPIIRRNEKPDFLVHAPGRMTNLLVVEVKPSNAKLRKMVKDLKTLTYFRRGLGDGQSYFAAYFWVYGMSEAGWRRRSRELLNRVRGDRDVDLDLIRPVIHQNPGQPATFVDWPA